jgi:hypoxanthine phosphoribosyltransferase
MRAVNLTERCHSHRIVIAPSGDSKMKTVSPTQATSPMKVVVPRKAIIHRCVKLGQAIHDDFGEAPFTALWIGDGAHIFSATLIPQIKSRHVAVRSLRAKSYEETESTGEPTIIPDRVHETDIRNKRVLLIDDILDTGRTLTAVKRYVQQFSPAEIRICVLLHKPSRLLLPIAPDYIGFEIPDVFVVGFGLDYQDRFREMRYVAILDEKTKEQVDREGCQ